MLEELLIQLPLLSGRSSLDIPADFMEEHAVSLLVEGLREMPLLRELRLLNGRMGRNDLSELAQLEQVRVLKWLNTGERKRTPVGLFKMKNLQSLEIRQSDFRIIPDEIEQLPLICRDVIMMNDDCFL